MELRYAGFSQTQNKRFYKFDQQTETRSTIRFIVSVDMALFLKHHIGIQEGPALCARKLTSDLEAQSVGDHELTNADLLAYASDRAAKEAQRLEARRPGPHRRTTPPVSPFSRYGSS